jgi:hypothetical protein
MLLSYSSASRFGFGLLFRGPPLALGFPPNFGFPANFFLSPNFVPPNFRFSPK